MCRTGTKLMFCRNPPSPPKKTHRPELIISGNVATSLIDASIGPFTLAGHTPTNCVVELGESDSRERFWKINETL